jgi:hypothetical protein
MYNFSFNITERILVLRLENMNIVGNPVLYIYTTVDYYLWSLEQ